MALDEREDNGQTHELEDFANGPDALPSWSLFMRPKWNPPNDAEGQHSRTDRSSSNSPATSNSPGLQTNTSSFHPQPLERSKGLGTMALKGTSPPHHAHAHNTFSSVDGRGTHEQPVPGRARRGATGGGSLSLFGAEKAKKWKGKGRLLCKKMFELAKKLWRRSRRTKREKEPVDARTAGQLECEERELAEMRGRAIR